MTAPDPSVATVRLLAGAATTDATDDDIAALLAVENGVVRLAAADLLELMAGRLQMVESDDVTVDGTKQAAVLMQRAAQLRAQHYEHGGDFFFDTVTTVPDYANRDWFNDSSYSDAGYEDQW